MGRGLGQVVMPFSWFPNDTSRGRDLLVTPVGFEPTTCRLIFRADHTLPGCATGSTLPGICDGLPTWDVGFCPRYPFPRRGPDQVSTVTSLKCWWDSLAACRAVSGSSDLRN